MNCLVKNVRRTDGTQPHNNIPIDPIPPPQNLLVARFTIHQQAAPQPTMTAGTVSSSSALCTLTVAQSILDQDLLLQLVVKLASSFQVHVKVAGKSSSSSEGAGIQLQLGPHAHDNLLTQRGAVIRALCGMGLHCALDQKYRLLGGHGSTARKCSLTSRLALASLTEWMSVADMLRGAADASSAAAVLDRLEKHLIAHAYLIPSPQATVADLDVAIALLRHHPDLVQGEQGLTSRPHLTRWLYQCYEELRSLVGSIVDDGSLQQAVCNQCVAPPTPRTVLPIFYNGTEAVVLPNTPSPMASPKPVQGTKPKSQPPAGATQQKQQSSASEKGSDNASKETAAASAVKADSMKNVAAASTTMPAATSSSEFTIAALDIRVGKIVEVWHHETADKLFCETIDLGTEQRKIASGLRPFYQTNDLLNKHVLVLCNLKARNLLGFPSHGMVLCASNADHTAVELVVPPEGAALGERVTFEGYIGEPEPENKMNKKKIFEVVSPELRTNDQGMVVWKDAKATTSAGEVKALNGMPNARVA